MNEEFYSILVSLLAGLQTVFSPCLFPVLPAYLIFLAKEVRSPLKVTLAFVASLSASLLAYAIAVAQIGRTLLLTLNLTPDVISFALATIFACLAVIELLPARSVLSISAYRSPGVGGSGVARSAILGALFALAAAPCASAPLLAWTAILLLHPGSVLLSLAAFLAGVTVPFVVIGALAQSVGPRLHRAFVKSLIVRRSHEFSAALFLVFALIVLTSAGNPLSIIARYIQLLDRFTLVLLSLALPSAGISLIAIAPRATRLVLLTAIPPISTGVAGVTISILDSPHLQSYLAYNLFLDYFVIASGALTATLWLAVSAMKGGRIGKWVALTALALTFYLPPVHDLLVLLHEGIVLGRYILSIVSLGAALSLLAVLVQVKTVG